MKMRLLDIVCIVLLTAGVANAEPVFGPNAPDYRDKENSVHAVFESPAPLVPLQLLTFDTGPSNYPLMPINPSIFSDGFVVHDITLPNFIDELPMKKMRIQLEFFSPVYGFNIGFDVIGFDEQAGVVPGIIVGSSDLGLIDIYHYIDIEMYPNPDFEEISIRTQEPFLRSIEIDTISIPEPASIGLLGLISGGIFFARRFFVV